VETGERRVSSGSAIPRIQKGHNPKCGNRKHEFQKFIPASYSFVVEKFAKFNGEIAFQIRVKWWRYRQRLLLLLSCLDWRWSSIETSVLTSKKEKRVGQREGVLTWSWNCGL